MGGLRVEDLGPNPIGLWALGWDVQGNDNPNAVHQGRFYTGLYG